MQLKTKWKNIVSNPLFTGTAWMVFGNGSRIVIQGLYFILLARTLKADGLGIFSSALALVSILAPFSAWGSGNRIIMYASRNAKMFSKYFGNAVIVTIISGFSLGIILLLVNYFFLNQTFEWKLLLLLIISDLFFFRLIEICGQSFQSFDKLNITAQIYTATSFARLVAAVLFTFKGLSSPYLWGIWYCATSVIAGLLVFVFTVYHLGKPIFSLSSIGKGWREGFFFSLGTASKTAYTDINKTMLTTLESPSVSGIYTAAHRIILMIFVPVQSIIFSSNTRLFRLGKKGISPIIQYAIKLLPIVIVYGIIAGFAAYLFAPIMPLILGEDFAQSVSILQWLIFLPTIQGMHYLLGDSLMGAGFQGPRSIAQVLVAIINLLANFILIPQLSWKGAVISTYLAEGILVLIMIILILYYLRKEAIYE